MGVGVEVWVCWLVEPGASARPGFGEEVLKADACNHFSDAGTLFSDGSNTFSNAWKVFSGRLLFVSGRGRSKCFFPTCELFWGRTRMGEFAGRNVSPKLGGSTKGPADVHKFLTYLLLSREM